MALNTRDREAASLGKEVFLFRSHSGTCWPNHPSPAQRMLYSPAGEIGGAEQQEISGECEKLSRKMDLAARDKIMTGRAS